jgi:hypothetical protein
LDEYTHIYVLLQFSGPHCAHTFRNFKRSCIMLYAKPLEHPSAAVALSIVILLSALKSTLPPTVQLLLSQSQQDNLIAQDLRLSNVLQRISRLSCEPLYATNTSHLKQETFL